MNVLPAKVAGVEKIVMCTPCGADGKVYPSTPVSYTHLDVYKRQTFQMLMVIVIIFNINLQLGRLNILGTLLIYVALVLTVVSLIDYIAKKKDVLKDQK